MKKLMKLGSLVAFLFVIGLAFSSFTSGETETSNNGVIVEVVKNHVYTFFSGCADPVESVKSTTQTKNGEVHLVSIMFELPEGHCWIPEKKAVKGNVPSPLGLFRVNVTPSGNMIAKLIINN